MTETVIMTAIICITIIFSLAILCFAPQPNNKNNKNEDNEKEGKE